MNKEYFLTMHQIIKTGHWFTDQIGLELKAFGITEPQYNVLRILDSAKGKPVTVQEILNGMVQRNSNITRIVDKLIQKGATERKECPTNRRKMDITITESGKKLLNELDKKVLAFHKPMMDELNSDELKTLNHLINKLTNNTKNNSLLRSD